MVFKNLWKKEIVVQQVRAPPCQDGSCGFESRQSRCQSIWACQIKYIDKIIKLEYRRYGQVVRQKIANLWSSVQIWVSPFQLWNILNDFVKYGAWHGARSKAPGAVPTDILANFINIVDFFVRIFQIHGKWESGVWPPTLRKSPDSKKNDVQVVIINKNFIIMIIRNLSVICLPICYGNVRAVNGDWADGAGSQPNPKAPMAA